MRAGALLVALAAAAVVGPAAALSLGSKYPSLTAQEREIVTPIRDFVRPGTAPYNALITYVSNTTINNNNNNNKKKRTKTKKNRERERERKRE